MKKLLPPLLFAIFVALMFASEYLPGAEAMPPEVRSVGGIVMSVGLALLTIARWQFAKAKTNILTFNEPGQLVTTGVFRVSRHPMYLGFSMVLMGLALMLRSIPALCVAATFVQISDRWYIAFEERWLLAKFGDTYVNYSRRTRRWFGWATLPTANAGQ